MLGTLIVRHLIDVYSLVDMSNSNESVQGLFQFHIKAFRYRYTSLDFVIQGEALDQLAACGTDVTTGKNIPVGVVFPLAVKWLFLVSKAKAWYNWPLLKKVPFSVLSKPWSTAIDLSAVPPKITGHNRRFRSIFQITVSASAAVKLKNLEVC